MKIILFAIILLPAVLRSQVPYATSPDWISSDVSGRSTGAAWADINDDGWMDLVIANGNDMARQRVVVYYNDSSGTLPQSPDWQSADIDYHGHLSVGDVNNDGFPDVAVSVYIGAAGFGQRGKVKLYMNNAGTLESTPSWESSEPIYSFSCALGDADGDGDLDLAVAGGESYNSHPERNRIYYNHGGMLDGDPGWQALSSDYSYDVAWADFDDDGDLDLVFANEFGPNTMYQNDGDSIGTTPAWTSTDPGAHANSLFCADADGDGYVDLAVSDNNQLGGEGRFKVYHNAGGILETIPFWTSAFSGYGSGISFGDVDNDGDQDLLTGGWWQPCRIYLNGGGSFPSMPDWTSLTGSVVEAIVLADCDNDGLDTVTVEFPGDGSRRLFTLSLCPLQRILTVTAGEDTLSGADFCFSLEGGWVSCSVAVPDGSTLRITVVVSHDLDCAVSNWDGTVGNYIFLNTSPTVDVSSEQTIPSGIILYQNYPNPFNGVSNINFQIPEVSGTRHVTLTVYDVLGREVAVLADGEFSPGSHTARLDAGRLSSGVYLYTLRVDGGLLTGRALLVR